MTTARTMMASVRASHVDFVEYPVGSAFSHVARRCFAVAFLPADSRVRQTRRITAAHLRLWNVSEATAENVVLAVSELVTNAIRHGQGAVNLKVLHTAHEVRVEVTDGNSRPATLATAQPDDTSGRGLFLVAAVADRWGVSDDGTTTWCSLAARMSSSTDAASTSSPEDHADADEGAVLPSLRTEVDPAFRWSVAILAGADVGSLARERVRSALMGGRWQGNLDTAARLASELVVNAFHHGETFPDGTITLRLIVDADTRELLIEVEDAFLDFPGFADVAKRSGAVKGKPTGLWWVAHSKGRLSWGAIKGEDGLVQGKRVQAILPAN
jgi:serine/threonine-protein kinase RsbW